MCSMLRVAQQHSFFGVQVGFQRVEQQFGAGVPFAGVVVQRLLLQGRVHVRIARIVLGGEVSPYISQQRFGLFVEVVGAGGQGLHRFIGSPYTPAGYETAQRVVFQQVKYRQQRGFGQLPAVAYLVVKTHSQRVRYRQAGAVQPAYCPLPRPALHFQFWVQQPGIGGGVAGQLGQYVRHFTPRGGLAKREVRIRLWYVAPVAHQVVPNENRERIAQRRLHRHPVSLVQFILLVRMDFHKQCSCE